MCHEDHLAEAPLFDDSIQIQELIHRGVGVAGWFVGLTPPEKIERDHVTRRPEIGNEAVVKVQIIWKAMHEDDRWPLACILSHVNPVLISLYEAFSIVHLLSCLLSTPSRSSVRDSWFHILFLLFKPFATSEFCRGRDLKCERSRLDLSGARIGGNNDATR